MLEISKYKDKSLYRVARAVRDDEFGEDLLVRMTQMAEKMYASGGVGLSGPQVGDSRRILVADIGYVETGRYGEQLLMVVNPEIIRQSKEMIKADEGCLSYPGLDSYVLRPSNVVVKFFSVTGEEKRGVFSDWQARILLHEIDHLNGVTLYTRSSRLKRSRYDKLVSKGVIKWK